MHGPAGLPDRRRCRGVHPPRCVAVVPGMLSSRRAMMTTRRQRCLRGETTAAAADARGDTPTADDAMEEGRCSDFEGADGAGTAEDEPQPRPPKPWQRPRQLRLRKQRQRVATTTTSGPTGVEFLVYLRPIAELGRESCSDLLDGRISSCTPTTPPTSRPRGLSIRPVPRCAYRKTPTWLRTGHPGR